MDTPSTRCENGVVFRDGFIATRPFKRLDFAYYVCGNLARPSDGPDEPKSLYDGLGFNLTAIGVSCFDCEAGDTLALLVRGSEDDIPPYQTIHMATYHGERGGE